VIPHITRNAGGFKDSFAGRSRGLRVATLYVLAADADHLSDYLDEGEDRQFLGDLPVTIG